MVFSPAYLNSMLQLIEANTGMHWMKAVLKHVFEHDQQHKSGFSEYETYGNYMKQFHSSEIEFTKLRTSRHGRQLFNGIPLQEELLSKNLDLDIITFENWC